MNYEARDTYGMYKAQKDTGPGPRLLGAETLIGNDVYNLDEEDIGDIKEIMLDVATGGIAYAVLSFGSFLGMGEKLFAVPWSALKLDTENKRFILNVEKKPPPKCTRFRQRQMAQPGRSYLGQRRTFLLWNQAL